MLLVSLTAAVLSAAQHSYGANKDQWTLTTQGAALAPNAGGQVAYTLKLYDGTYEYGGFSNQYLLAGDLPLSGITASKRFHVCDDSCWWKFFVQTGAGLSNGGPLAQISWGTMIPLAPIWLPMSAPRYYPALRIDMTTQFIFIQYRAVTWSYPLWVGISVPF